MEKKKKVSKKEEKPTSIWDKVGKFVKEKVDCCLE